MAQSSIYFAFPGDLHTPSGGYHYDRRLIGELRHLGMEVETLSLPACFPALDSKSRQSIRQSLAALPDRAIVMVDGLVFGVMDELAAEEARRLRLVALCHHPLGLESGLDERLGKALLDSESRALACTRAAIVTSEHTARVLVDRLAVPGDKIAVALPGTERTPFADCDGEPLRLLTVASLIRRKAHDVLIDSLASLLSFPWQARFVGGGDFDSAWAASLRDRVDSLGLSDRIEFAGPIENSLQAYQQADVFVLPSRYEGYGMVFAEALAAGLPIIAANSGAIPEVVPESAGLLVAPDDRDALTAALQQVLIDPSLRRRLQAGARQAAGNLPSWSDTARVVAAKLEEIGGP